MTQLDPRYRGKDFLKGFIPSLIPAVITVLLMFTNEMIMPLIWAGVGLVGAALIAFVSSRPFIGLGILTVLIATPLLLIGSCFALM
jgi:hypothetical protein